MTNRWLEAFATFQSKKEGTDQELMQSSTKPDPGYHMRK